MKGKEAARWVLELMERDGELFASGRRNDDAVNMCCACVILGRDPKTELLNQHLKHRDNPQGRSVTEIDYDFDMAKEHVERVIPYADNWYETWGDNTLYYYGIDSSDYMINIQRED